MSEPEGNGQKVTYTVKELIAHQTKLIEAVDEKLDGVVSKLDQKADSTVVAELRARVDILAETTIKREGPVVTEWRGIQRLVDKHENDIENIRTEYGSSQQTTRWWITGPLFFVANLGLAATVLISNHPWSK